MIAEEKQGPPQCDLFLEELDRAVWSAYWSLSRAVEAPPRLGEEGNEEQGESRVVGNDC